MEIKPFIGIGEVEFGKPRHTIRGHLGSEFTSFKKTPSSLSETDAYDNLGIYLFYDENDCLDFCELYPPFIVTFMGISFFEQSGNLLENVFKEKGINLMANSVGYDAPDFGFGIYVNEGKVRGVYIYKKDYYMK